MFSALSNIDKKMIAHILVPITLGTCTLLAHQRNSNPKLKLISDLARGILLGFNTMSACGTIDFIANKIDPKNKYLPPLLILTSALIFNVAFFIIGNPKEEAINGLPKGYSLYKTNFIPKKLSILDMLESNYTPLGVLHTLFIWNDPAILLVNGFHLKKLCNRKWNYLSKEFKLPQHQKLLEFQYGIQVNNTKKVSEDDSCLICYGAFDEQDPAYALFCDYHLSHKSCTILHIANRLDICFREATLKNHKHSLIKFPLGLSNFSLKETYFQLSLKESNLPKCPACFSPPMVPIEMEAHLGPLKKPVAIQVIPSKD